MDRVDGSKWKRGDFAAMLFFMCLILHNLFIIFDWVYTYLGFQTFCENEIKKKAHIPISMYVVFRNLR